MEAGGTVHLQWRNITCSLTLLTVFGAIGGMMQRTCGLIRENLLAEMNPEIAKKEMVAYMFSLGICSVCC